MKFCPLPQRRKDIFAVKKFCTGTNVANKIFSVNIYEELKIYLLQTMLLNYRISFLNQDFFN